MTARTPVTEQVQAVDTHGEQVQAMFSDIAPGYDRANRLMSLGTDVRWRNRAVKELLQHDPRNILDLCAGTLDSSKAIAKMAPRAKIMGSDFSAGMIRAGEATLSAQQRTQIQTQIADAHHLPFEDQQFDALFCAFGVRNLSDLAQATKEKARCLTPGAQLVVLDFFRPTQWWTKSFHSVYNHSVLPLVGWACTGNLEAYRYLPRSIGDFVTAPEYAAILKQHGFESVRCQPLTGGIATMVCARRIGGTQAGQA